MNYKCPICGNADYEYESYGEFGIGIVEQHGYCEKCGYCVEQAYTPVCEFFLDTRKGWKDSDGKYHEKNIKRHKRIRKKNKDRIKGIEILSLGFMTQGALYWRRQR